MAVIGDRVAVSSSPTRLGEGTEDDYGDGWAVAIRNAGANVCDLGGPTVAAGEGFELEVGGQVSVDLDANEKLYAVSTDGTTLHVLIVGVK